ncbi:TRAP transporter small permease [Oceanibium sediminis]|uniref:TRAP transporter small permease n=1 Tax=Oceanibium sediminis TaxID=2026339 RepID=UPI001300831B|nr:TRAP transporter small permease [Oceanibium sediminis]
MQKLIRLMEQAGALALMAIVLLMATTTITRYLFNWPLPDVDAVSRMLLAVVAFWGLASACLYREHIKLDLLTSVLPRRIRAAVLWISDVILMGALGLMAWMTAHRILDLRDSGEKTYDLGIVLWPFYLMAYVGLVAAAAVCITNVLGLTGKSAPRSEADDAIERARSEDTTNKQESDDNGL